jgi:hypothetical protein
MEEMKQRKGASNEKDHFRNREGVYHGRFVYDLVDSRRFHEQMAE